MAQKLGLHLNPDGSRVPYHEILLRKQLSWIIFAMNKWLRLALHLLLLLLMKLDNYTDPRSEGLGFWNLDGAESVYSIQFSKLTSILHSVMRKLLYVRLMNTVFHILLTPTAP
jgi:hypothetical protein